MALSDSIRLALTRWGAGTDPLTRAQLDGDNATLDDLVAIDMQGTLAARPAAGVRGRYYLAKDTGRLWRDDGTAWQPVIVGRVQDGLVLADGGLEVPSTSGSKLQRGFDPVDGNVLPRAYPDGFSCSSFGADAPGIPGGVPCTLLTVRRAGTRIFQTLYGADGTPNTGTITVPHYYRQGYDDGALINEWGPWQRVASGDADGVIRGFKGIDVDLGPNAFTAAQLSGAYPTGFSFFYTTAAANGGWPAGDGVVETIQFAGSSARDSQTFREQGTSAVAGRGWHRMAYGGSAWGPWFRVGAENDAAFGNAVVTAQTNSTLFVDTPSGPSAEVTTGRTGQLLVVVGGALFNSGAGSTLHSPKIVRVSDAAALVSPQDRYGHEHAGTSPERASKLYLFNGNQHTAYRATTALRVTSGTGNVNEPQVGLIALG